MAESHVPRGDVECPCRLPEALPPIQGDPHQLRQLFTNLLTNAFEAMGGAGDVAITARRARGEDELASAAEQRRAPMVQVDVADNGPGMPPEVVGPDLQPVLHDQAAGLGPRAWRSSARSSTRTTAASTSARAPDGGATFRVTLPVRARQLSG